MKSVFVFFFLFSIVSNAQVRLGLNDLAHLLPLPKMQEVALLLHARSLGLKGELLPYAVFQKLPRLVPGVDQLKLYQQSLKVVALRFDPCFMEGPPMRACQPQVRLVWQPLVIKEYSAATIDASVHTFYNLTTSEWQALMQEYVQIKSGSRAVRNNDPLQVSPALLAAGYQSPYWQRFSELLLKRIGAQNLSRLTFMNVNPMGNAWAFGAYTVSGQHAEIMPIPGIDKKAQVVISKQTVGVETMLDAVPRPVGQDFFFLFANDSAMAKRSWKPEQIQAAVIKASELENTRRHNSGTVSCASCHMTRSVSLLVKSSFPQWNWKQILNGVEYVGANNMINTTATFLHGESLRMLGYFDRTPIISDRVIHDTDLALRSLGN